MKHAAKQIFALTLALLISLSFASAHIPDAFITASAHSGRTDSHGGHHDYKNASGLGSYHYHHGYPAHLHENGICPYDNPQPAAASSETTVPETDTVIPAETDSGAAEASAASLTAVPAIDYTPVFDAAFYAAANPDVAAIYGTDAALLFQHFLTNGMQEGRQGNAAFNVWNYIAENPDLAAVFGNDLPQYYTYYCMMNG